MRATFQNKTADGTSEGIKREKAASEYISFIYFVFKFTPSKSLHRA